ncbi:MAG: class II fructose-bisphosphate aldolase [Parcubacteria group bacterium]|nr:class II fructose-bisphosphate aldolase [Parcubacteria group bacterium]
MNLNDYLKIAKEKRFAVPHFNFASAEQLEAIVLGFKKVLDFYNLPYDKYALMAGTSEGEAKFLGYKQARALADSWKKETNIPIFLNADHHKSFESCKEAVNNGYDTVLIDASAMPLEENIKTVHQVIDYAKSVNSEITVEGELGYLRGESKLQETIEIRPDDFTKPEEAKEFVEKTGVDRLAVVFGNIHGIVSKQEEKLDFNLLKKINEAVPETFLVLHGGSGLSEDDFKKAVNNGITNIHINTEVRVAYREGLDEKLKEAPKETTPYKFLEGAVEKMREVVEGKVKVFLNV